MTVPMAAERCVHHYVLGEPSEGVVQGRCRRCGAERTWPAAPGGTWDRGPLTSGAVSEMASAAGAPTLPFRTVDVRNGPGRLAPARYR